MNPPLLQQLRDLFGDGKTAPSKPSSHPAMGPGVHPTAVLNGEIEVEEGATIGPYCVINGRVKIGARTQILAHSVVEGTTLIGADCRLGPCAAVGTEPQHRGYDGRETYLVVEDRVIAREFSSMHRATKAGLENATRVGRGSLVMAGAHVAHDCRLGENVTMANAVQLGGHVTVGDAAIVGGGAVVHQFCRIGRLAMVGGGEIIVKDVLPFGIARHGGHRAYNAIGCRRAGFSAEALREIRSAFHTFHAGRSFPQAAAVLRAGHADEELSPQIRELVVFIDESRRGIQTAPGRSAKASDDVDG